MAFATALIFAVPVLAADAIYSNWLGKAIAGYDPVAFHTAGKPVEGVSNFTTEWKGAKWYFVSAENRNKFFAMPENLHRNTAGIAPMAWPRAAQSRLIQKLGKLWVASCI